MTYCSSAVVSTIAKFFGRKNTYLVIFGHVFSSQKIIKSHSGDIDLCWFVTAIAT
ncbi:hypothetical protein [[Leptolyngbya] sp. PCC 7376]|uniref:hypothetical protein n=1 Tax=[Leptolyngbya] sp. PCC 7376 TaxID=111781 RepID=UPI000313A1FC|nr:hypothetical protein [[Leptolyngbya] sp. PCC 7376]